MKTGNILRGFGGIVFGLACLNGKAFAHGGHDPRLKVMVSETEIRVETSLDAKAFMEFDTNGDGRLSVGEYEAQLKTIRTWLDEHLNLESVNSDRLQPYFADAPIVGRGNLEKIDVVENVKIFRRYRLDNNPTALKLTVKLYDESPQLLYSRSGSLEELFSFSICFSGRLESEQMVCKSSL